MAIDYFVRLIGNLPVGEITEKKVEDFRDQLLRVPSEYGKGIFCKRSTTNGEVVPVEEFVNEKRAKRFRERTMPIEAIVIRNRIAAAIQAIDDTRNATLHFDGQEWSIEQAKRKTATMTRKTANKHLSFFTKLWTSKVVPRSLRPMSPFSGALFPKSDVRNDKVRSVRKEYTKKQLQTLFSSPVWTGCRSALRRSVAGDLIIPDARFWAPLIAIFTGMRREEICQLKGSDFDEHGDIWFVKFQATEGRSLKTPAAERDIPIHDELIRIGLPEFVEHRDPDWLFPELRPSSIDRALGDSLGKWYNRYRHAIGLTQTETDFHSFRKTFTQYLRRAGVPLDHIKPITGHQEYDITLRHYAPAFSLEQKKTVIERFDLGVGFPQIYGRMPTLLQNLEALQKKPSPQSRPHARAGDQASP